jgi:trypsin
MLQRALLFALPKEGEEEEVQYVKLLTRTLRTVRENTALNPKESKERPSLPCRFPALYSGSSTFPEQRHSSAVKPNEAGSYPPLFDKQNHGAPRIIGGSTSLLGTHPYFVRVNHNGNPYCGGSLVATEVVATAAHCYTTNLSVVVNGYDESQADNLKWDQRYRAIKKVLQHPNFNPATFQNDIMLLFLNASVTDIPGLKYLRPNFNGTKPVPGDELMTMGLGLTSQNILAQSLQEVILDAIDPDVCSLQYRKGGLKFSSNLMLCAGRSGKDSCFGDSGGPLIDIKSGDLVGITSWGVGCALTEYPGAYTRISAYNSWLKDNICLMSAHKPAWCTAASDTRSPSNVCLDKRGIFTTASLGSGINTCAQLKAARARSRRRICRRKDAKIACQKTCDACGTTSRAQTSTGTRTSTTTRPQSRNLSYGMLLQQFSHLLTSRQGEENQVIMRLRGSHRILD